MRVLKTVQSYYPFQDRGGPVFKVRSLARGLACRGHQVSVLTADLGIAGRSWENFRPESSPWGWHAEDEGVDTYYLPSIARYRALTFNPRLWAFCRATLPQFDLVHIYGLYDLLGPCVSHFCRRRGIPYVIEPMGMHRPIDRGFALKRLWHSSLGKSHVRHAAQIVATSELERADLIERGISPDRVVVRYNGIDLGIRGNAPRPGSFREKWKISPHEPLILLTSRLIPRKGADILIEAFAKVCSDRGTLVIAGPEGEAGYQARLQQCAAENGVAARVIFTGPVYESEKASMYSDADVFVLPSRYENFANVVAEAISCETPAIVSNTCGIHPLVEGRAGLVIPPDRDSLAAALRRLLDDRALYARLKSGCSNVAGELAWGTLSGQMENHYSEVLSRVSHAH